MSPGPWKVAKNPDQAEGWWGRPDTTPHECIVTDWADVPICATNDDGIATNNDIANARLIAAAPDLLEALKDIVCSGCGHRIGWNGIHDAEQTRLERVDWRTCNHCKPARAAIAKAEDRRE